MMLSLHRRAFAALALAFALAPPDITAAEARASGNVPVRSGPGSGYPVVDRLLDGQYYEVEDCARRARWCLVSEDGDLIGWVRGSYLVGAGAKARVTPFELLVKPKLFDMQPWAPMAPGRPVG